MKTIKNIFLLPLFYLLSVNAIAQEENNTVIISDIVYEGLKVTKPHIVDREIIFAKGDTLTNEQLLTDIERSEQNISTLRIFNTVTHDVIPLENGQVMILFNFKERFYTFPVPIFKFEEPNFSTWLKEMNFARTSYGLEINRRNFRGRNETVVVKAQLGFTKKVSFQYYIPYITKGQKLGMYFTGYLNQNDDVVYQTRENERLFFTDSLEKSKVEKSASFGFTYRNALYATHDLNLSIRNVQLSDSLGKLNPNYLLEGASKRSFLSMFYLLEYNKTDNDAYPLIGSQMDFRFTKFGLGVLDSKINVLTIRPTLKKYWKLRDKLWFQTKLSLKYSFYHKMPYRIQEGLGFGETFVRGYEFYVIDGQHYALLRNNIKFSLLSSRNVKVPFFKSEKFSGLPFAIYLNAYTDIGYVRDDIYKSPLSNILMRGSGLGLDFVMAYDQVWRLEFSLNDRSEGGFYVSYKRSI